MEEKDCQNGFEEYLLRHPDLNPEIAERLKPIYEGLDDEIFAFVMANIVL